MHSLGRGALSRQFELAEFGDQRLTRRLGLMIEAFSASPGDGIPKAMGSIAAIEAAYRFLSNPAVTPERILEPHFEETHRLIEREHRALVVHDTSFFEFSTARRGLGRHCGGEHGFFGHVALALKAEGGRCPLGVLGLRLFTRTDPPPTKKRRNEYRYRRREGAKESDRWRDLVEEVERRNDGRAQLIHVMDREADSYLLLAFMAAQNASFVIRAHHDRVLGGNELPRRLWEAAEAASPVLEREVPVSARRPRKDRPPAANRLVRDARLARLSYAATTVTLRRAWAIPAATAPATVTVNVVRVFERTPPTDVEPIEWLLLTDQPIDTVEDIARIVDWYRDRWTIEEFFKALKTGCKYESLQLESLPALSNALATMLPIATRMLQLRHASRSGAVSASEVLSASQLGALRAVTPSLPKQPTAKDALIAIARLGGHIKNNGDPGWLVIYRGFRDLLLLEAGWSARGNAINP